MKPALLNIWCATNTTLDKANTLNDFINNSLSKEDHSIVVALTNTWYIIAGNQKAKDFYELLVTEAKKH